MLSSSPISDRAVRSAARVCLAVLLFGSGARADENKVIDDFDRADAWTLIAADGVGGQIVEDDGALRLDYDFTAGAGYCVVRRTVDLALDPNYRFSLRFKGTGPPNTLEFKLVDPSGENVWWSVQRGFPFPSDWSLRSMRRRHFSFAWGPSGGAPLTKVGAIEIAVTAVGGGKGSIWLDDLVYEKLPEIEPTPTEPRAVTGQGKQLGSVGPDGAIVWSPGHDGQLDLIFNDPVEFSAMELEWAPGGAPGVYHIERSRDGISFERITTITDSDGGVDVIFTPESEARAVRLVVDGGGAHLSAARFFPVEQLTSANDYFSLLASRAPRGAYPLYFGALSPWTVIGLPHHDDEALVSATGAIEPAKRGYSLEPMIVRDGRVLTWADAERSQSLEDQSLPIPSVRWELRGLTLDITALATEHAGTDRVRARYTLTNTGQQAQSLTLALAARPFQVLPAAQFLNTVGGVASADSVTAGGDELRIDGRLFARADAEPDAVLVANAPSGALIDRLVQSASRSTSTRVSRGDFPSGALLYDMTLVPGASRSVVVTLAMNPAGARAIEHEVHTDFDAAMTNETARWSRLLGHTEILAPDSARHLQQTIRANLAYILINADGAGIQPGSRSYERSWIRDGAMTSAALIALGHGGEARGFIEWYSRYQYPDGKIPCVVDARGADPVDENDAPGEFIFAIRNSAQAGGVFDEAFARAMFPRVRAAVGYIETMRSKRLTPEYTESDDPIKRASTGLMPESISHEGYSAKPMHSYWDDFWVYRGLNDAAELADLLGEAHDRQRFAALSDAFGESIGSSVSQAAKLHGIGYVPGCVELGDFDATSTAIAFYPTRAADVLDRTLLEQTFERAWDTTQTRINGGDWDAMTPYEVRLIGTFIRLGWIDRAHAYLGWLMERRDPQGWHQWGEIAYQEDEPCRFVGDMPHTWVGSGAILSILSMFAYEQGDSLVLAGGVPGGWLDDEQPVGIRGQVTRYGTLSYTIERRDGSLELVIGPGCRPPGGFRIGLARLFLGDAVDGVRERLLIEADGHRVRADEDGVVALAPETRRVTVRLGEGLP